MYILNILILIASGFLKYLVRSILPENSKT